jgi:hypothetical protein
VADSSWLAELAELDELRDIALEGIDPRLRLLTTRQVMDLLHTAPGSLSSPAWRRRVGLPAVYLGRRIVRFRAVDVARVIARGLEFPTTAPAETAPIAAPTTSPSVVP